MTTSRIAKTLAAAVVMTSALAATSANAFQIRNCTGDTIRVNVYNNHDIAQLVPLFGGQLRHTQAGYANASGRDVAVKVFQSRIIDALRISQTGVDGGGDYTVRRRSNGAYYLRRGDRC